MRFLLILFLVLSMASMGSAETPAWIWSGDRGESEEAWVTPIVWELADGYKDPRLRITADFAHMDIEANGETVGSLEAYDPPLEFDLTPFLKAGENRIDIKARGVRGPSAIAFELSAKLKSGKNLRLSSTARAKTDEVTGYGKVHPYRWAPNRLPEVSPFAEYNQWKEATPGSTETLSPLPEGFEIEVLRRAKEKEGSWVSMVFDPGGRLIVAREKTGLLRMTLGGKGKQVVGVEVIEDTLKECRGLAFRGGDLFANANNSKALYRLRDNDGDGRYDETILIQETGGSVGHGRNDVVLGPDGRMHAIHGDVVHVPMGAQMRTAPERGAPKGLGHWVSTKGIGDGNDWVIHSRGLRNPYGIDFNPDGEPFTYDADNEGDVGLPFYRPTRINHLVSGANYGWHQERGNTRNMTVYAPDSVPTTFDIGRGSPTAVKFGTRSNFPPPWKDALFALDWAYGRIIAVHLTPRGASYYGSGEVFLEGRPLNVTDLDFDEDGAMYFVTGGRKTQSALYRVRYAGKARAAEKQTKQARARVEFSAKERVRRRKLERIHGNPQAPGLEDAWEALGDPDPWIRNAARVAIETQELERWTLRPLELAAKGDLRGLTAMLAWARSQGSVWQPIAARRVTKCATGGWGRTEVLTALRIYELALSENPRNRATEKWITNSGPSILEQVGPLLESHSDPVRREAVRVLVLLGAPEAVPAGMKLQAEATGQLERLHHLEMLSEAKEGWTTESREAYFRALAHARRFSRGDRFMPGFFGSVEKNALENVSDEEERAHLTAILDEGNEIDFPDLPPREFVQQWTVDEFADGAPGDRDLANGKKMFDAAQCSRCHVHGTRGRPIGPDLTTVARRFSRRDLLEAIIEPSKVVAEVHRNVIIKRRDGTVVQGRIIQDDFRKSTLHVATNPFLPGEVTRVPKGDIESSEESPVSPMPQGLLNTLTRDDVLDLLAWLTQ